MFLRYNTRKKDGKEHRYWSVVENRRLQFQQREAEPLNCEKRPDIKGAFG